MCSQSNEAPQELLLSLLFKGLHDRVVHGIELYLFPKTYSPLPSLRALKFHSII